MDLRKIGEKITRAVIDPFGIFGVGSGGNFACGPACQAKRELEAAQAAANNAQNNPPESSSTGVIILVSIIVIAAIVAVIVIIRRS